MKIGMAQIDMGFETPEIAMDICSNLLKQAKAQAVDFIVFPEMTCTGFTMHPETFGELRENSKTIAFFQSEAKKNKLAICFGLAIYEEDQGSNRCIIIDETGEIIADYGKLHCFFGPETKRYRKGNALAFCQVQGVPLSPFICYDLRFPEPFLIASEKSHIITVIANWPSTRREHWITLLTARAIENQCFIIGVNRCGQDRKLTYVGDSMIISPTGECLIIAEDQVGLITYDIDPSQAEEARRKFPLKESRNASLYCSLWEKYGKQE